METVDNTRSYRRFLPAKVCACIHRRARHAGRAGGHSKAAFQAPTAGNQQLYTILDITDPALKATLADLCDHQPFIAGAPLVLVFLADCRRWLQRLSRSGHRGCTQARGRRPDAGRGRYLHRSPECRGGGAKSLGIGSCYIGDVLENAEQMREALHLPQHVVPACMLVFGRPTEQQKRTPQARPVCRTPLSVRIPTRDRTHDELRADFTAKAAANGQHNYDFDQRRAGILQTQVRERLFPGNDEECRDLSGRVPKVN